MAGDRGLALAFGSVILIAASFATSNTKSGLKEWAAQFREPHAISSSLKSTLAWIRISAPAAARPAAAYLADSQESWTLRSVRGE
jgi:hypothetical protein